MNGITKHMMVDVFKQIPSIPFADLYFRNAPSTQLKTVIAIHSTKPGPVPGAMQCSSYQSTDKFLKKLVRLVRGMAYKSAINRLQYSGGKALMLYPEVFQIN